MQIVWVSEPRRQRFLVRRLVGTNCNRIDLTMPHLEKGRATAVSHFWDESARGRWRGATYDSDSDGPEVVDGRTRPLTIDTVWDLIRLYRASGYYLDLTPSSRESYDQYLARIADKFGNLPLRAFERRGARAAIRQWRDSVLAHRPRTADLTVGMLRRLLNFGVDEEYLDRNPASLLGRLHTTTRRDKIWSDAQIATFLAKAPRHIARALLLAIWTGQRQADLIGLTWSSYDGTYIRLQQGKGAGGQGRRVKVLVAAELRKVLEEIREEQVARSQHPDATKRVPQPDVILTTERGSPWQSGFKCAWRRAVRNAGITGVTFHDLRGTFITLAHRARSPIKDIAEATGHDELECERTIRRHYLATGAELVISKLEVVSEFTDANWDAGARSSSALLDEAGLPIAQDIGRSLGPRRARRRRVSP